MTTKILSMVSILVAVAATQALAQDASAVNPHNQPATQAPSATSVAATPDMERNDGNDSLADADVEEMEGHLVDLTQYLRRDHQDAEELAKGNDNAPRPAQPAGQAAGTQPGAQQLIGFVEDAWIGDGDLYVVHPSQVQVLQQHMNHHVTLRGKVIKRSGVSMIMPASVMPSEKQREQDQSNRREQMDQDAADRQGPTDTGSGVGEGFNDGDQTGTVPPSGGTPQLNQQPGANNTGTTGSR